MGMTFLIGTLLGFLSGLGIGGGSLLILWLTLAAGMEPRAARAVNLWFFLPAAVVACYYRKKQGTLDIQKMLPAIAAGCIGAVLGSKLGENLDTSLLKKGFGILLMATGLREILWKPKKKASQ